MRSGGPDSGPFGLYAVTHGATTIWERWVGWTEEAGFQDPKMNSFNHYAYGAVGDWMYRSLGGINLDESQPGYKNIIFRPRPFPGLDHARVQEKGVFGSIVSSWKVRGTEFELEIEIPSNSSGILYYPEAFGKNISESGAELTNAEGLNLIESGAGVVIELASGKYRFVSEGIGFVAR